MSLRGYNVPVNSSNTDTEVDDNACSVVQTEKFLKNPTIFETA